MNLGGGVPGDDRGANVGVARTRSITDATPGPLWRGITSRREDTAQELKSRGTRALRRSSKIAVAHTRRPSSLPGDGSPIRTRATSRPRDGCPILKASAASGRVGDCIWLRHRTRTATQKSHFAHGQAVRHRRLRLPRSTRSRSAASMTHPTNQGARERHCEDRRRSQWHTPGAPPRPLATSAPSAPEPPRALATGAPSLSERSEPKGGGLRSARSLAPWLPCSLAPWPLPQATGSASFPPAARPARAPPAAVTRPTSARPDS